MNELILKDEFTGFLLYAMTSWDIKKVVNYTYGLNEHEFEFIINYDLEFKIDG